MSVNIMLILILERKYIIIINETLSSTSTKYIPV